MSEPVPNPRAEHILASIRRLVSRNDRPDREHGEQSDHETGRAIARSGHETPTSAGGMLLLTPALRVKDPDDRSIGGVAADAAGQGQDLRAHPRSKQRKAPAEPKHANATTANEAVRTEHRHVVTSEDAVEDRTSVLRLDESVRLVDEPKERHGGGTSSLAMDSREIDRRSRLGDPVPANEAAEFNAEDVGNGPRPRSRPAGRSPADSALEEKIAALEAAIARTEGNWEPDGDVSDAFAGKTSHASDRKEQARPASRDALYRLEAEDRRDLPQVREAEGAGAVASLTDLVDEDMLRDIVADIVRQELRGAMGDRITRNVRKLVRREILQALESRDLD